MSEPRAERVAPVLRHRRLLVGAALGVLTLVVLTFVLVLPMRAVLTQRGQISNAEQRLELLRRQSTALQQDTEELRSDAEIERIARDRFGMVRPGETAWAVVPEAAPTTTTAPAPAP